MDAGPVMIVDRYFQSVRDALASEAAQADDRRFQIPASDLVIIAADQRARARFRQAFVGVNDPDGKALIRDQLRQVATALEGEARRSDARVDLVDRAALTPSAGVTTAALVALATGGLAVAPLLLASGLAGIIGSAVGRHRLKLAAIRNEQQAKDILSLLEYLEPQ